MGTRLCKRHFRLLATLDSSQLFWIYFFQVWRWVASCLLTVPNKESIISCQLPTAQVLTRSWSGNLSLAWYRFKETYTRASKQRQYHLKKMENPRGAACIPMEAIAVQRFRTWCIHDKPMISSSYSTVFLIDVSSGGLRDRVRIPTLCMYIDKKYGRAMFKRWYGNWPDTSIL